MSTRTSAAEKLQDALLEDFPSEINKGKDGEEKSVKPGYYIEKLLKLRSVGADEINITHAGPTYTVTFDGMTAIVKDVRVEVVAESFRAIGDGTGTYALNDKIETPEDLAKAVKAASSDALKRACLNLGVNLSTYLKNDLGQETEDEEEEEDRSSSRRSSRRSSREEETEDNKDDEDEERPRRSSSRRSGGSSSRSERSGGSRGGSDREWDGSMKINFGKHEGTAFNKVIGSWLDWAAGEFDGKRLEFVEKEIERRKEDDTWDPEEGKTKRRGGGRTQRSGKRSGRALDGEYD